MLLELQDVCNESEDKNTLEARILKSVVDQKQIVVVKVWFVGTAYTTREKYGNRWVEYRDPIDLMNHPSNMNNDLCWHQKGRQQVDFTISLII